MNTLERKTTQIQIGNLPHKVTQYQGIIKAFNKLKQDLDKLDCFKPMVLEQCNFLREEFQKLESCFKDTLDKELKKITFVIRSVQVNSASLCFKPAPYQPAPYHGKNARTHIQNLDHNGIKKLTIGLLALGLSAGVFFADSALANVSPVDAMTNNVPTQIDSVNKDFIKGLITERNNKEDVRHMIPAIQGLIEEMELSFSDAELASVIFDYRKSTGREIGPDFIPYISTYIVSEFFDIDSPNQLKIESQKIEAKILENINTKKFEKDFPMDSYKILEGITVDNLVYHLATGPLPQEEQIFTISEVVNAGLAFSLATPNALEEFAEDKRKRLENICNNSLKESKEKNRNEKEASQQMLHDVAYYLAYEFVIMVNGAIPTEAEMKAITNSINNVISVGANIEQTKEKCLEKEAGKTLETQEEINTSCY